MRRSCSQVSWCRGGSEFRGTVYKCSVVQAGPYLGCGWPGAHFGGEPIVRCWAIQDCFRRAGGNRGPIAYTTDFY